MLDFISFKASLSRMLNKVCQVSRALLLSDVQPESGRGSMRSPYPLWEHLVCHPHKCKYGGHMVALGHHALSCKVSGGRLPRHCLNNIMKRELQSAGIPYILEPTRIDRGDGKRQDGITAFPSKQGKCLLWDATCTDTFAKTKNHLMCFTCRRKIQKDVNTSPLEISTSFNLCLRKYRCLWAFHSHISGRHRAENNGRIQRFKRNFVVKGKTWVSHRPKQCFQRPDHLKAG